MSRSLTADPERSSSRRSSRTDAALAAVRNLERPLSDHELFFSTTDTKGVITAGNEVFERVSGYPLAEMIGRAHNIVRHPDMPRAVFAVLWETIAAGRPVAAYVRNRTADGAYYWVLASVMPITNGYLSVRLAPGSEHFAVAKKIYGELVAIEREVEGDDVRQRKPSIAASAFPAGGAAAPSRIRGLPRLHARRTPGRGSPPRQPTSSMNTAISSRPPRRSTRRRRRDPVGIPLDERLPRTSCDRSHPVRRGRPRTRRTVLLPEQQWAMTCAYSRSTPRSAPAASASRERRWTPSRGC